jgi:PilZ domain
MISLVEFVSICGVASLTAAGASQGLQRLRRTKVQCSKEQARGPIEESSGRPAPGIWHEPRDRKRHAVNCRIEYILGQVRHEGMLVDMSLRGWRAHGMHPVAKDTLMTMEILCPDPTQRIMIAEAVVRWTDGLEFGVEVIRISPDSAEKLSDYLNMHYPQEEPAPVYALSPFSYS